MQRIGGLPKGCRAVEGRGLVRFVTWEKLIGLMVVVEEVRVGKVLAEWRVRF